MNRDLDRSNHTIARPPARDRLPLPGPIGPRRLPQAHGFTLIELLVVVAIIAMLIAMLLPSLAVSRDLARRVVCSSQMRQQAVALATYAAANSGQYPPPVTPGSYGDNWPVGSMVLSDFRSPAGSAILVDSRYVEDPAIFYCPSAVQNVIDIETHWYPKEHSDPGNWLGTAVEYCYWPGYRTKQTTAPNDKLPDLIVENARSPATRMMFSELTSWNAAQGNWWSWSNHLGEGVAEPQGGNVATHDGGVAWRNFQDMELRLIRAALQFYF